jgi:hypothetical protein
MDSDCESGICGSDDAGSSSDTAASCWGADDPNKTKRCLPADPDQAKHKMASCKLN